jgi:hypothetical protein
MVMLLPQPMRFPPVFYKPFDPTTSTLLSTNDHATGLVSSHRQIHTLHRTSPASCLIPGPSSTIRTALPHIDFGSVGEDAIAEYIDLFVTQCNEVLKAAQHELDDTAIDLFDGRLLRLALCVSNTSPKTFPTTLKFFAKQIAWDLGVEDSKAFSIGQIRGTTRSQIPPS